MKPFINVEQQVFCTIVVPTVYTTDKAYLTQIFYLKMLFFKQVFQ